MKSLIVGVLTLLIPVSYVFYLLVGKMGVWKTMGLFILVIVWTSFAVNLMYKGAKQLS